MRALCAFAAVGLAAAPASATPAEKVIGLLDVRADGVDEPVASRFGEAVEDGLTGLDGYQIAPRKRMQEMLAATSWSSACTVGPCMAEVRAQTGAAFVVTAGLAGSGMSYRYTLTLLDTEDGTILRQVSESCPACTVEDLESQATLATIELVTGAAGEHVRSKVTVDVGRVTLLEDRVRRHARITRRTAVLLIGVAAVAAAVGTYLLDKDQDDVSYPLLGAAGGLAASGVVMLGLSLRF